MRMARNVIGILWLVVIFLAMLGGVSTGTDPVDLWTAAIWGGVATSLVYVNQIERRER